MTPEVMSLLRWCRCGRRLRPLRPRLRLFGRLRLTHVPPGDHGALVRALERLLIDPALRRAQGQAAYQHAMAHFRWPVVAEAIRNETRRQAGLKSLVISLSTFAAFL